jgi:hypothetical protein
MLELEPKSGCGMMVNFLVRVVTACRVKRDNFIFRNMEFMGIKRSIILGRFQKVNLQNAPTKSYFGVFSVKTPSYLRKTCYRGILSLSQVCIF